MLNRSGAAHNITQRRLDDYSGVEHFQAPRQVEEGILQRLEVTLAAYREGKSNGLILRDLFWGEATMQGEITHHAAEIRRTAALGNRPYSDGN